MARTSESKSQETTSDVIPEDAINRENVAQDASPIQETDDEVNDLARSFDCVLDTKVKRFKYIYIYSSRREY